MPTLKQPKHEQFAQAYARSANAGNATACYRAVFGEKNMKAGWRLRHRKDVTRRINELMAQDSQAEARATERAVTRLAITKEAVLNELARIAFANLLDYLRPDGGGFLALSQVDRDKAAALQEISVDTIEDDDGEIIKRVRYKLADKRAALVTLGKHFGMFVNRSHLIVEHAETPDADLIPRARDIVAELLDAGFDLGVVPRVVGDQGAGGGPQCAQPALPLPAVSEAADVPCGGGDA